MTGLAVPTGAVMTILSVLHLVRDTHSRCGRAMCCSASIMRVAIAHEGAKAAMESHVRCERDER